MNMYGKIIDNNIVEIYTEKPKWYFDNGSPVDDEYLVEQNIYPLDIQDGMPEDYLELPIKYNKILNQPFQMALDLENKVIKNVFVYEIKTANIVARLLKNEIENQKNLNIYKDIPYNFPDGQGTIQCRNELDIRNIQINGIEAIKDLSLGITDKTYIFRDLEDKIHHMTLHQMIDMMTYVKNVGQNIFIKSWAHKNNIDDIINNTELTEEDKLNQLYFYDFLSNWS